MEVAFGPRQDVERGEILRWFEEEGALRIPLSQPTPQPLGEELHNGKHLIPV